MRAGITIHHVMACGPAGTLVLGSITAAEPVIEGISLGMRDTPDLAAKAHLAMGAMTIEPGGLLTGRFALRIEPTRGHAPTWLILTLADGQSARVDLPAPTPGTRGSLLLALSAIEPINLDDALDGVLGPAIAALHAGDVAHPVDLRHIVFGRQTGKPSVSLIIPLHKRIDHLEVQLALFCDQPCLKDAEILFVVDDPPRQQEAAALAASAHARFDVAFTLIMPSRNMGFARASNAGLRAASGHHICFLNSDVFPATPDWMSRLIAGLTQDRIGIMAPLLLFPDGSVQHRGMVLQAIDRFAGWHFPRHMEKGFRPHGSGIERVPAVTGACMVMTRQTAQALGGFDEDFVIGDFEDSDLCLRAEKMGLAAAVHLDVPMVHLERQSQGADAPWRMGATLYNAWRHERRWFARPAALAASTRTRRRRH